MGRLTGQVALVTGGGRGLGLVFAEALKAEGAEVLAVDLDDAGAGELDALGIPLAVADISDPGEAEAAVTEGVRRFGRVDILVNNAAVYSTLPMARYDQIDPETLDRVLAVNVRGTFNMIRAAGPGMEARGHGRIINITSGTVLKGMPGMMHYIASKGAVAAMTKALSREMGESGVTVNSLAPGLTLSSSILKNPDHVDQTRAKVLASRAIKRDGQPEDLVGALIYLASAESAFMTGQTLVVDGGSVNT